MVSNVDSALRLENEMGDILQAIACLQRLADAFHVRRGQLAATAGLTDHQWGVLEEIATEHFMPSMFARRRQSSAAAVSKTLRQLIDKGLVTASVDRADGRHRQYVLTARGKRTMDRLRAHRQTAIDRIWADLDVAALQSFVRFGTELTRRLEDYAEQSADPVTGPSDGPANRQSNG